MPNYESFRISIPNFRKKQIKIIDLSQKPTRFRMGFYTTIDLILVSSIVQLVRY